MKDLVRRWWPAILMMLLIFGASSIPGHEMPSFGLIDFDVKKGGHMLGYALLAAGYLRGLIDGRAITRSHWCLAVLLACLYAATDEFHQSFVAGRNATPVDVGIDTVGAIIGVTAWAWIKTTETRRVQK